MSGIRVVARAPQAMLERVGNEGVIHDRASGRVHVVNGSAARLWELCEPGRTMDDLVREFAAGYQVEPEVVRADVAAVVEHFRSLGLVS